MAGTFMKNRNRDSAVSRYAREDNEPGVGEPSEGELIALQSQEAIEEVMAVDGDVTALQDDGEELATVYGEVLPEVHEVLDSAQEAGGITVEAVSLLAIIGNLTGTDLSTTVATESFNGQGRSQQATRVALEAVTDRLGNWWQALKRWLKKMWKKVKDELAEQTFSGAASLKAAAESMKKRAQASTSKVIKNENVSFSGANLVMNKDGKIVAADVKAGFKLFADRMDSITLKYPKEVADAGKKFVDKVAEIDFGKGKDAGATRGEVYGAITEYDNVVDKLMMAMGVAAGVPSGSLGVNAMFDKNVGQGETVKVSPPYPGNKVLYKIVEEGGFRVGFAAGGKKEPEGDIEGKALGISDITGICESIINACDSIVRSNSSINSTSKVEDDLEKCGDRIERVLAQEDSATEDAHKKQSTFTRAAKVISESLVEPHRAFASHFMASASAVLRYASSSLQTAN